MFQLSVARSFWWPVRIRYPDQGWKAQTLELQFKFLSVAEFDALLERARREQMRDPAVAAEVVLNWREVVDAEKRAIPFSADRLAELCAWPGAASSIVRDFIAAHTEAAEKNS